MVQQEEPNAPPPQKKKKKGKGKQSLPPSLFTVWTQDILEEIQVLSIGTSTWELRVLNYNKRELMIHFFTFISIVIPAWIYLDFNTSTRNSK